MDKRPLRKLAIAISSALRFTRLIKAKRLHLQQEHLGKFYKIHSNSFLVFRDTKCYEARGEPVVLIVGFRLRIIRSNRLLHWLFQRLCILTTPFWCGLDGFSIKLWMVSPATKDYLGIYDWRGDTEVQYYINYLLPILHFFSVPNTVWYNKQNIELEKYLKIHQLEFNDNYSGAS